MTISTRQVSDAAPSGGTLPVVSKETLAFEALAKLAKQFSSRSEINELIQVFLWTLSGQFSVANAFVLIHGDSETQDERMFCGMGAMKSSEELKSLHVDPKDEEFFLANRSPLALQSKPCPTAASPIIETLANNNVWIVVPLVYERELIGLVGLGEKVTKKEMTAEEFDLLEILLNTTIPFIANCMYFRKVSRLNYWYFSVLDSVRQAIFVFDTDFRLQKMNSSGLKLMEDCGVGQWVSELDEGRSIEAVFPHEIFPNVAGSIRQSVDKSPISLNHVITRISDVRCVFDLNMSCAESILGSGSDIVVTLEDVTARENIEQKLFGLEKFAEKGKMAASIAHELNNFLALLLGGVELLDRNVKKSDLAKLPDRVISLREVIQKMKRFTVGLMDHTKFDPVKAPMSLNKLISNVLSFVTVQDKFKDIFVETDLDASIPLLSLDNDQVSQVLINLLNNSADAIQESSKTTGKIVVRSLNQGNTIAFEVADNGAGMTSDVQQNLFKIRQTTKQDGHGFGMVTCGRIIESHQGSVSVSSAENGGTTIKVTFPSEDVPDRRKAKQLPPTPTPTPDSRLENM